ncbi:MAG: hypothetical protein HY690_04160 [Chloroflexi bacterium]|nr:hypothetical protein [Chloroflexota bacterium]
MRARSNRGYLRIGTVVFTVVLVSLACAPRAAESPGQAAPGSQKAAPAPAVALGDTVPRFKILTPTAAYRPEQAEACGMMATELQKLGFSVEVATHPSWGGFVSQVGKPFDWGIGCAGFVPREDRLEPNQLIGTYESSFADDGPNYSGYKSAEYDRALAAQRAEMDQEKRRAAVYKAQEILARDLPMITQFHPALTHVYNKAKFGDVVSIPGVGLWNVTNFVKATPLTSDTVYRVGFVGDMNNLNPLRPVGSFDADVIRLIWEPLGKFDSTGKVGPWLAEKWETVNPTTVRVTIRDGHRFHDGQPVTARDVAFSYNYMIKWKPAWYRAAIEPFKNAEATDSRTVVFTLSEPFAPLVLTLAWVPILPEHIWKDVVEKEGAKSPVELKNIPRVGSGPYRWVSQTQQVLRLARNEAHFSPPKASEFLWTAFSNRESEFLAMANQDIYFHEQKGLTIAQMEEAKNYPHLEVITEPSIDVTWMIFNMRDNSPFKDFALRHAVAHLLDYEGIVRDILKGFGEPGRGMIAPANKFWHNAEIPSKETAGKTHYHQYDPAKARQILQEAGFGWDQEGKLHFPKDYKPAVLPTEQNCCK